MGFTSEGSQAKVRQIMVETFCSATEALNALRKAGGNVATACAAVIKATPLNLDDYSGVSLRKKSAKDSITTDRCTQLHRALDKVLDKVLDAKPLDYDAPQIAARRKKIRELEASGLAHDNPKIAKLREEIRKLQDGQSLS